jgi:hypothetical protein
MLPGVTVFFVSAIELHPIDDYTGSKQYIGLFGDKTRIDILWDARYNPDILHPINVTCWLNCNNSIDLTQCYGLQNCSYEGKTGPASCTILNPSYNYSALNNVTCKFFDPLQPNLEYRLSDGSYPQRVFYPIRYHVSAMGGTYQVGKTINLPITFLSYSFLKGNYSALAYVQQSSFIAIDNTHNTTKDLRYSQIDTVYPKITVIYVSGRTQLFINTTANELPYCSFDADCPDIATKDYQIKACIQNKCQYVFITEIGSAYLSLPEYGTKELGIVIIIALIMFFLVLRLKK